MKNADLYLLHDEPFQKIVGIAAVVRVPAVIPVEWRLVDFFE